ncbi:MAG: glycosyltransferase family 1 protein [Ignavibacteriae bacterium]|nr:MAG: glycosyltransferase family 1 protein [Ignavibacteriota bacterium]
MKPSVPRILIDARGLQEGFKTHNHRGIGHYASNLIDGILDSNSSFQFIFLVEKGPAVDERLQNHPCIFQTPKWFEPAATRMISEQWTLPRTMPFTSFDLVHFLAHGDGTMYSRVPSVVSVMDTISLSVKELYSPYQRLKHGIANSLTRRILQHSRSIIAISEHTKEDIIKYFAIPSEKIHVVPLAAEKRFFQKWAPSDLLRIRTRFELPENFLLYVGGIDPRKNVGIMFNALKLLFEKDPAACPLLAFAGDIAHQREYPQLMKSLHALGIGNRIRFLGYVPEKELPLLYQASTMFLFPSRYEGFGLPVLQAMAAGTPVITTKLSSIPEVAGDAALYIHPDNPVELARAITEIFSNHALRSSLVASGMKRAGTFSWERTVNETFEVYREALMMQNK